MAEDVVIAPKIIGQDLTGKRFGRLICVSFKWKHSGAYWWNCQCDCGETRAIRSYSLTNGSTKSCGCLQGEIAAAVRTSRCEKSIRQDHEDTINLKTCDECGKSKFRTEFYRTKTRNDKFIYSHFCIICSRKKQRDFKLANKDRVKGQRKVYNCLRRYGMTPDEIDEKISSQGGVCAICKIPSDSILQVDHCHSTGQIREMLCWGCNCAIGKFRDDPNIIRAAAEYIERHEKIRSENPRFKIVLTEFDSRH